jgi:Flp pilus assembly protein TadD
MIKTKTEVAAILEQALSQLKKGKAEDALFLLKKIIKNHSNNAQALYLLGAAYQMLDQLQEAVDAFNACLVLDENHASAKLNLTSILIEKNQLFDAMPMLLQLQKIMPEDPILIRQSAKAAIIREQNLDAYIWYRKLIEVQDNQDELWAEFVMVAASAKKEVEALTLLEVQARPHISEHIFKMLHAYLAARLGLLTCEQTRACMQWQPSNLEELLLRLSFEMATLFFFNEFRVALEFFNHVQGQFPTWENEANEGMLLLANNQWQQGWEKYAARNIAKQQIKLADSIAPTPPWQGEDLAGKTLLIHAEQGAGDIIQFIRFLPELTQRGAQLRFNISSQAARLFMEQAPETAYEMEGEIAAKDCDYQIRLLDVPRWLKVDDSTLPGKIPYLTADPAKKAFWHQRLKACLGFKIGLVWAGNPEHWGDNHRSTSLDKFMPLFSIPGVSWISMQKGAGEQEAKTLTLPQSFIALGAEINDFTDTAAILDELDLVISVDTSVAHLAAALGRPTWILIGNRNQDWRWQEEREDTPWYPTMRLFRQPSDLSWGHYINGTLKEQLNKHLLSRSAPQAESAFVESTAINSTVRAQTRTADEWTHIVQKGPQAQESVLEFQTRCEQALEQYPFNSDLILSIAQQYRILEHIEPAKTIINRLLSSSPKNRNAWMCLGQLNDTIGNLEAARDAYATAWIHAEDKNELSFLLGSVFYRLGAYQTAMQFFAIFAHNSANLVHPERLLRVIRCLAECGQSAAAASVLAQLSDDAIHTNYEKITEHEALFWHHYGDCTSLLKLENALAILGLKHELPEMAFALNRLKVADWQTGWPSYLQTTPPKWQRWPLWQGEPLQGQNVLLFQDQGAGDAIQFFCLMDIVKQQIGFGSLSIAVSADLIPLFRANAGADIKVIHLESVKSAPLKEYDVAIPWMHLPCLLGNIPLDSPPKPIPYLRPPTHKTALPESAKNTLQKRVGIAWAGNPRFVHDFYRSSRLNDWHPLFDNKLITWYSLQKDNPANQAQYLPQFEHINVAALCDDFAATASVISQLDLVITVDTAVAHLAAAIGSEVWILLPAFGVDFRWGQEDDVAAWYPTARLFRQKPTESWINFMQGVAAELLVWQKK